jgi:beta-ribofuranosylaminobenzene 5'-phosphate synthase
LNSIASQNPASVTVTIPARLHLGFLDLNGDLGRRFGGIGLAISQLKTAVTIRKAERFHVAGSQSERAKRHVTSIQSLLGLDGSFDVSIDETVPAHAGLGSGTQLALAIAAGVRRLHGLPLDIETDAVRLGRGARSGLGIGLFHRGGLVVDGGRGRATAVAPIVSHMAFPPEWRVLVLLDPSRQGVHGPDESVAFAELPAFSARDAADICRLVIMKVLPGVAERDLASFGAAITEIQERLGDYFASVQGGRRFTSPAVAAALDMLDREGASGIGQSSWGPTGFAFTASQQEAERLTSRARDHPSGRALDIRICAGLNRGADIVAGAKAQALG